MNRTASCLVLSFLLVSACDENAGGPPGDGSPSESTLALTDVSVVDVETGQISNGQTIVVRGDRIAYVGDSPPADALAGAAIQDHAGDYVIPGLWDMHIHLRNSDDAQLVEENALWLRQYLGFGVTAVRDAGGDLPQEVLAWRAEIEAGTRRGPRIFTSLQKLDGAESPYAWPGSIHLTSEDDIEPAIDRLDSMGADFVKLYDGSLDGALYLDAIAAAGRRGLRTSGHLPLTVLFEDAIAAGLDSVEHEIYLAKAASGDEAAIAQDIARAIATDEEWSFYATLARLQASVDEQKLERVFDLMIERGAALTPTLHIGSVLDGMTDASIYEDDAQLAEVPPAIRATFADRVGRLVERSPDIVARDLAISETNRALVKAAADRGVMILAGSDTGAVNSYLYPGDSLHRELASLVEIGLSPLAALQAATVDAARWLGRFDDFGSVESGKVADLVVLEGNPLSNIDNTRSIAAVIQAGEYLDSEALVELRKLPR